MEREGQGSSGELSQTAEEEQSRILERKRVIMAVTQMLDSGTLDEKSSRLLGQLASCIRCLPVEAALGSEPNPGVTRQSAPWRTRQPRLNHQRSRGRNQAPAAPPKSLRIRGLS